MSAKDEMVEWWRILNKKGWHVSHWPKEYGGTGWSSVQHYIFNEELQMAPAPAPLAFGVSMVGPVIYTFGTSTEEALFAAHRQRRRLVVPGIFRARLGLRPRFAQDKSRAQGRQIYRQRPEDLDHAGAICRLDLLLCRTDPCAKKQSGISFILIDMKSKGITVRPIQTIDGGVEVNEVFFDDVEVPVENLVGEENKGWDYAKFLLGNERTGIARGRRLQGADPPHQGIGLQG
jgi:alkylation response protein AidB-like acyl-CoA dehydrogenase